MVKEERKMKKVFAMLGAALLMAACARNIELDRPGSNEVPEKPVQESFGVSISVDCAGSFDSDPATKSAFFKSYFYDKDVVFVFFKGIPAPKYLELKYNADLSEHWEATPMNGLSAADLSAAADKKMTAIYLPYGSDAAVTADGTDFQVGESGYRALFYQAENVDYAFDGTTVMGSLHLTAPALEGSDKYVHFNISGFSGFNHQLYQDYVKPIVFTGVSSTGEVAFSVGDKGHGMKGYFDEFRFLMCFSGVLDESVVGKLKPYKFCVDDGAILYSRSAGNKTLSESKYIDLGSLTQRGGPWSGHAYFYLGFDKASGEKICWAQTNVGDESGHWGDDALYFPYLSSQGYTYDGAYGFTADEWANAVDGYDPATDHWGWPWRVPEVEEWQALVSHTTRLCTSTDVFFYSTVPGYTEKDIFLPAAGCVYPDNLLYDQDHLGCYWASSPVGVTSDSEAPAFTFSTQGETRTDATYPVYCGLSVRPVFTLPAELPAGFDPTAPRIVPASTSVTIPGLMSYTPGYIYYTIENPVQGGVLTAEAQPGVEMDDIWIFIDDDDVTDTYVRYQAMINTYTNAETRTGTIRLQYPGAKPVDITVNQYNWQYEYTVLEIPQTTYEVSNEAASYAISYTIANPIEGAVLRVYDQSPSTSSSWLTPRVDESQNIYFTVTENTKPQSRSCQVTFKYTGARAVRTVTITQAGKPAGPPEIDLLGWEEHGNLVVYAEGEEYSFYANVINPVGGVTLEMKPDVAWITNIRPQEGYDNMYLFTASPNATGRTRIGHIDFTYGTVQKRLGFKQEVGSNVIILSPGDLTFNYQGRTVAFNITLPDYMDEANLSVAPDVDYRYIKNLQLNGKRVTFDLKENNDGFDRDANIIVTYGEVQSVFHLTQTYEAPVFTLPTEYLNLSYQGQSMPVNVEVTNPRETLSLSIWKETDAAPWLWCSTQNNIPTVNVAQNATEATRIAYVQVGYSDSRLGSVRLRVAQTGSKTSIEVIPNALSFSHKAGDYSVSFSYMDPLAGVDVQAEPHAFWIHVSNITSTNATVSVDKNYWSKSRSSSITFYYGDLSFVVPVSQEGNPLTDGFVDLGLPSGTLWAEKNLGATQVYESGNYYAWGEVTPKKKYTWDNYAWGSKTNLTKYNGSDGKTVLDESDDPAWVADHSWRTPSVEQFTELWDNCDWEWTLLPVPGIMVKSRVADTYIFFPAAGYYGDAWDDVEAGCYWTSLLSRNTISAGLALNFVSSGSSFESLERSLGMNIRPVK